MNRVTPSRRLRASKSAVSAAGRAMTCRRAAIGLHRGARAVGGQLEERGRAGELLRPVGELRGQAPGPASTLALPDGVVGVLEGQRGQRGGLAVGEGRVEGRELADEHAQGPAVGDDVVDDQEQDVLVGGQVEQRRSRSERAPREVEGAAGLLARPRRSSSRLARGGGQRRAGPRTARGMAARRRDDAGRGWPSWTAKVVRRTRGGATSSSKARCRAAASSGPCRRTAQGML